MKIMISMPMDMVRVLLRVSEVVYIHNSNADRFKWFALERFELIRFEKALHGCLFYSVTRKGVDVINEFNFNSDGGRENEAG